MSRSFANPWRLASTACAALLLLSACNDKDTPAANAPAAPVASTAPDSANAAPQTVAYTHPSADVLYQMVAPIALYPDKLVAQILAGSTYPDQVSAAESWLGQNPGLQKAAFANSVNAQSWDPSIKSLTQFPNVLEQMASNLPWTTALGKAYYNDPSDVLNAIQVMRNRAYKAGSLKGSKQLTVNASSTPTQNSYTPADYNSPMRNAVIAPPEQYIEIAPSDVRTVYVPQYNPGVAYGAPLPIYQGYRYMAPAPVMNAGVPVATGILGFGAGVLLMQASQPHPSWGWNSWNMHWGDGDRHDWRPGNPPPPPMARPAVVYNQQTYISQSRTVVQDNRRTENVRVTNVYENNNAAPPQQQQQHGLSAGTVATGVGVAAGAAAVMAAGHGFNHRPDPAPAAAPAFTSAQNMQATRQPVPAPQAIQAHAPQMPPAANMHGAMNQQQAVNTTQMAAQNAQRQQQAHQMQQQQQQQQMQQAQAAQQRQAQHQQAQQMQAQQQAQRQAAQAQQRAVQAQQQQAMQNQQHADQMRQQQQQAAQAQQHAQQMQQQQQAQQRQQQQMQQAQQAQQAQQQRQMQAQAQMQMQRQQQAQQAAAQRQQQMAQQHAAQAQRQMAANTGPRPHSGRDDHQHR